VSTVLGNVINSARTSPSPSSSGGEEVGFSRAENVSGRKCRRKVESGADPAAVRVDSGSNDSSAPGVYRVDRAGLGIPTNGAAAAAPTPTSPAPEDAGDGQRRSAVALPALHPTPPTSLTELCQTTAPYSIPDHVQSTRTRKSSRMHAAKDSSADSDGPRKQQKLTHAAEPHLLHDEELAINIGMLTCKQDLFADALDPDVGYMYKEWVLMLYTKQRNVLCKKFSIVGKEKQQLISNARRYKHNSSQKLYARRVALERNKWRDEGAGSGTADWAADSEEDELEQ